MSSSSNTASLMVRPSYTSRRTGRRWSKSGLQIAVHEVDLLQAAKALADVLRAHVPHAFHGLQLRVGRGEDLVQPVELAHDRLHHHLGQTRDASQNAVAA